MKVSSCNPKHLANYNTESFTEPKLMEKQKSVAFLERYSLIKVQANLPT